MAVRMERTATERAPLKRKDHKSPTGWSLSTGPDTSEPCKAPEVAILARGEESPWPDGTIRTQFHVDDHVVAVLTPREAEVVLATLLSSRAFARGKYGDNPNGDQIARAEHIERAMVKMGVDPADLVHNRRIPKR